MSNLASTVKVLNSSMKTDLKVLCPMFTLEVVVEHQHLRPKDMSALFTHTAHTDQTIKLGCADYI